MSLVKDVGCVCLQMDNGGAVFEVEDHGVGPTIKISTSSSGNLIHQIQIFTTPTALRELGEMFLAASQQSYSASYCGAAELVKYRKNGNGHGNGSPSRPPLPFLGGVSTPGFVEKP